MWADRSREQRRLAIEFMATARSITDSNIRASILALAQKWLDLAQRGSVQPEALDRAACLRDIQTKIGQQLRANYDLPQKLLDQMLALLMQLLYYRFRGRARGSACGAGDRHP
jgi:hypothetical protein